MVCIVRGGLKESNMTKLLSLSLFLNKKLRNESVKVENVSKKKKSLWSRLEMFIYLAHTLF